MLTGENVVSVYRLTDNRSFQGLDAGLSRDIHRRIEFLFSAAATPTLITVPQKLRAFFQTFWLSVDRRNPGARRSYRRRRTLVDEESEQEGRNKFAGLEIVENNVDRHRPFLTSSGEQRGTVSRANKTLPSQGCEFLSPIARHSRGRCTVDAILKLFTFAHLHARPCQSLDIHVLPTAVLKLDGQ